MPSQQIHGVELSYWEQGSGTPLLCLHETATSAEVWRSLAAEIGDGMRLVALDRRGWGGSSAPQPYLRTTIEEQAEDAAGILDALGAGPAILCGAGLGAVAALDLLLRRPEMTAGALLIEPPLLAFLPDATEGLSADRMAIGDAVSGSGPQAGLELYLEGGLPYLGAGAGRIPAPIADIARRTPLTLFAELAAVPAWSVVPSRLARSKVPIRIVISDSTPAVLEGAAQQVAGRLGEGEVLRVGGGGLAQLGGAAELAAAAGELVSA